IKFVGRSTTKALLARYARQRTIADPRCGSTPAAWRCSVAPGPLAHHDRGTPAQAQAFGGALLGARDLQDTEGIDQRQVLAGLGVTVGAQQREGVIAGLHQWLAEAPDERAV